MSLRKDTLSHAYELMKVEDPKKRKRLAAPGRPRGADPHQAARQDRGPASPRRHRVRSTPPTALTADATGDETAEDAAAAWTGHRKDLAADSLRDDSLVSAKQQLADAVETLMDVLRAPDVVRGIGAIDRANLAKYLTIAKLRLENAIAVVRSENG